MAAGEQVVVHDDPIFTVDELNDFTGLRQVNPHCIEIKCVCTSRRYGDTAGTLKISHNGKLEVACECDDTKCKRVGLSPIEFVKHGRKPATRWRNQIWVLKRNYKKVKLSKTCLLKHYKQPFYQFNSELPIHRDEFIRCTMCGKQRRFSQRTKEECRAYHDAHAKPDWTCFDMQKPCIDAEERKSRLPLKGCPRRAKCKGCPKCVCVGCSKCRFKDCNCNICVEYWLNQV